MTNHASKEVADEVMERMINRTSLVGSLQVLLLDSNTSLYEFNMVLNSVIYESYQMGREDERDGEKNGHS